MDIKKEEVFKFNIDYIEVYGRIKGIYEKIDELNKIEKLKDKNKNTEDTSVEFLGYKLRKEPKSGNYECKISFIKDGNVCFSFYKGRVSHITTYDYVLISGMGFKYNSNNEIYNFFKKNIDEKSIKAFQLKRFDLALDIKRNIEKGILGYFKKLNQKGIDYFGTLGKHETHYIGEILLNKNKRFLIRIYDKIANIKELGNQKYYTEYIVEKDITRVEIEFRQELCINAAFDKIFDLEYSYNLIFKYLKKHTSIFEGLKTMDVKKLSSKKYTIDLDKLAVDSILKEKYLNSFLGYAKTCCEIGVCPVSLMITNGYILKSTEERIAKMLSFNQLGYSELNLIDITQAKKEHFSKLLSIKYLK